MKISNTITLALVSFGIASASHADIAFMESQIELARREFKNAGLAVGICDGAGELIYFRSWGNADYETRAPIDRHTRFAIGSTTKAFTGVLAGTEVAAGRLDWDQPVRPLLPEWDLQDAVATEQSTLRDLLLHRTGLGRHDLAWYSRPQITTEQLLSLLPHLPMVTAFRGGWTYQNIGYLAAGLMSARSAGRSWQDLIRDRILQPLGMNDTLRGTFEIGGQLNVARPHAVSEEGTFPIPHRSADALAPAGALYSSATDLARWLAFHLRGNESVLPHVLLNETHRPQAQMPLPKESYAFGWIVGEFKGNSWIQHDGGIDGFLTHVAFFPDRDRCAIALTNGGDLHAELLGKILADAALEEENPTDWVTLALQKRPARPPVVNGERVPDVSAVLGEYTHPGYGTLKVESAQYQGLPGVYVQVNELPLAVLPLYFDVPHHSWKFQQGNILLEFKLDATGKFLHAKFAYDPTSPAVTFAR